MVCPSFKEKISSYLDGQLAPDEKTGVEEHLKSCSRCRGYHDELSRSVSRLQKLEEIESPSWLKQKVMARIREEACAEKSFWKKLFYPLTVKIPAGAVATIAIAVITIYIFRAMEPEVRLAKAPIDEVGRTEAPAGIRPKDSETAEMALKKDPEQLQKRGEEQKVSPPAEVKTMPALPMKKVAPQPRAAAPAAADVRAKASEADKKEGSPESPAVPERPAVQAMSETLGYQAGTGEAREESRKSVLPAPDAPAKLPAMKDSAVGVTSSDAAKGERAAALPRQKASVEMKKEDVALTVLVEDAAMGIEEVRKAVRTMGGTIVREESFEKKKVLILSISSRQYRVLLERLRSIGEISRGIPEHLDASGQIGIKIEMIEKSR